MTLAQNRLMQHLLALALLGTCAAASLRAQPPSPPAGHHTFEAGQKQFLLDGLPFQIVSGEMHYPRVPRAYWRDRLRKARAMGLNTITTYVFWNLHEQRPGVYDFSGEKDVAEYIREAQQEGLYVILRPGPYVCAEWELGGLPSWLLKDPSVMLRSTDPRYMAAVRTWFDRLGQEIKPLLLQNGGPILAVQVENEYGAFGDDKAYLEAVKQQVIRSGMAAPVLYTSNPPSMLTAGSLPELPTVINFGTGDAAKSFATLDRLRPEGPRMSGEYWAGWFDKWGLQHHATDGKKEADELRWMLEQGYSVSLYMFHGGTTFGWMNGADSPRSGDYYPDTTSYDYDAPLNESGEPTYKFDLFRKAIAGTKAPAPPMPAPPIPAPPMPAPAPRDTFTVAAPTSTASLWRNLPAPVPSKVPLTFEDLDQSFGYVLYRKPLAEGDGGTLSLAGLHDYAQVYIDQKLIGTVDRRLNQTSLDMPRQTHAATLDILVENTGRVNYSRTILTERTGLTANVSIGGKTPQSWQIYSLPMDHPQSLHFASEPCTGPCFFQTSMLVPKAADTYLDTRALHKGQLWLGDHNLGRFWSIGPQYALYTPGPWLTTGATTITFFDLLGDSTDRLTTSTKPIFGETKATRDKQ